MHIIYLLNQPLDARNYERFGLQSWLKKGHVVEAWYLDSIIEPGYFQNVKNKGLLKECPDNAIYRIVWSKFHLFKLVLKHIKQLRRGDSDLIIVDLCGAYPVVSIVLLFLGLFGAVTMKVSINELPENKELKSIAHTRYRQYFRSPGSLLRALSMSICLKYGRKYDISVVSGIKSLEKSNKARHIIHAHSADYDVYIRSETSLQKDRCLGWSSPYIVFLDQDLTRNVGFSRSEGFKPLDPMRYIVALRRTLKLIEEIYCCSIIVAKHPRASLPLTEADFDGFVVISSATNELVRHSCGVVTIGSSAVSFAALYSKPVLFLSSNEMEESGYINHNAAPISNALGLEPVNIDWDEECVRSMIPRRMRNGLYSEYIRQFLTSNPANRVLSLWDIIASDTEAYSRQKQLNACASI